jgi:hypothetical protein
MATGTLRRLLLIFICLSMAIAVNSQLVIIPETQGNGVVMKQQLWSLMINNMTGSTKNTTLYITVTDRQSSQVLLEGNSNVLLLNPGIKRVQYNDLIPFQYAVASIGFSTEKQLNQPLPVGEYLVCYRLFDNEGKKTLLVSECVKVIAEPLSPPLLVQPGNKSVVPDARPLLSWTPPSPVYMFSALSYDIIVSPLYPKQSPEEALQRNIPVMTTSSLQNSVLYPPTYTNLEQGKTYAWQVVAKDAGRLGGKSEVWTFSIMPDSVAKIISGTPYVELSRQDAELAVLQQGILKVSYNNVLSDSIISCSIKPLRDRDAGRRQTLRFQVSVKKGINFIEHNLSGKIRLDENTMYEARFINSAKEEWVMKFIPKYYF